VPRNIINDLTFSHEVRTYVFQGRKLDPPRPGTYDAAHWTPPTRQVFKVEIQNDGIWCVKLQDVVIASGDYAARSRAEAESILIRHCKRYLDAT